MYVEIRQIGKKKKYYLAHSFREGEKIHKIRRFLGIDLSHKEVEKLSIRAEEIIRQQLNSYRIIRDPLKEEISANEVALLDQLIGKQDVSIPMTEKDWTTFSTLFTYDTNAIEGSTLIQREVAGILEKNVWPDKPKYDIAEAYGVAEALKTVRKTKEVLSVGLMKKLHRIVFKNSKSFAGRFRPKGTEVVIRDGTGSIIHMGAPSNRVVGLLQELVTWYKENKSKHNPLLLAAVVHNQFENIHPFQDGNGRVGRLLLNFVLLKHKLPPVSIHFHNRKEYYASLKAYQKESNLRPTIDLLLKEYKHLRKDLR
ncbi:MAG: Fic family protein [Candidatus Woesearchaeota archaeon]|jgi:Fic family protein|nr:Fic family protein [Candidatus Woesearchaeota archaeon]MDP7199200.1 Fic family protein [Candidatus Woesearchaeota archaeon]MDP7467813.1 Fic family protein [Candidatus Woesearchaeota archaeon]MDP7647803.1 Fic family protein [Candidatus Woesearchaeota archaeon]